MKKITMLVIGITLTFNVLAEQEEKSTLGMIRSHFDSAVEKTKDVSGVLQTRANGAAAQTKEASSVVQARVSSAVEKTKDVIDTANNISCGVRILSVLLFISLLVLARVSIKNIFLKKHLTKHK